MESSATVTRLDSHLIIADLVRNLRHQLRTPVNHVVGFSEMLQEEAADRCWDALLPDLTASVKPAAAWPSTSAAPSTWPSWKPAPSTPSRSAAT
ncbi:MAG TPA: histidine kinase dimerization/phospho-acceptor domain-containing protein [Chloroflexota bacterium]